MGKHSSEKFRDNGSGQFVERDYGKSHPASTTKEHVPHPGYGTEADKPKGK